ncbi:hypothetical protein GQR58_000368 [Nymphon striatum]|nr:hypothetical protein GQR58_000368 [Nymphon striatum]
MTMLGKIKAFIDTYPALTAEIDRLKALDGVGSLHDEAVQLHVAKRDALLKQDETVLREDVAKNLAREIEQNSPDTFIVSAHQFGTSLARKSEMERLRSLLLPFSDDIRIVAHVEDPARMLSRYFASQVIEGRARSLDLEMGLLDSESWWDAARETRKEADPQRARFAEVQGAPFWLDFARLVSEWDSVFGEGATQLRALDHDLINGPDVTDEIRAAFDIPFQIGKAEPHTPAPPPPEAWLSRCRQMNDVLLRYIQLRKAILPRLLWRKFMAEIRVGGTPLDPGSLHAISKHFANDIKELTKKH